MIWKVLLKFQVLPSWIKWLSRQVSLYACPILRVPSAHLLCVVKVLCCGYFWQTISSCSYWHVAGSYSMLTFSHNFKGGELNPPSRSKYLSENIQVSKLCRLLHQEFLPQNTKGNRNMSDSSLVFKWACETCIIQRVEKEHLGLL